MASVIALGVLGAVTAVVALLLMVLSEWARRW